MPDDIDYKAIFEQVQSENEDIRIKYFKLKNEEVSFGERIKEWFSEIIEDERFPAYLNIVIVLLVFVIAPIVGALFRKGKPDVE